MSLVPDVLAESLRNFRENIARVSSNPLEQRPQFRTSGERELVAPERQYMVGQDDKTDLVQGHLVSITPSTIENPNNISPTFRRFPSDSSDEDLENFSHEMRKQHDGSSKLSRKPLIEVSALEYCQSNLQSLPLNDKQKAMQVEASVIVNEIKSLSNPLPLENLVDSLTHLHSTLLNQQTQVQTTLLDKINSVSDHVISNCRGIGENLVQSQIENMDKLQDGLKGVEGWVQRIQELEKRMGKVAKSVRFKPL